MPVRPELFLPSRKIMPVRAEPQLVEKSESNVIRSQGIKVARSQPALMCVRYLPELVQACGREYQGATRLNITLSEGKTYNWDITILLHLQQIVFNLPSSVFRLLSSDKFEKHKLKKFIITTHLLPHTSYLIPQTTHHIPQL